MRPEIVPDGVRAIRASLTCCWAPRMIGTPEVLGLRWPYSPATYPSRVTVRRYCPGARSRNVNFPPSSAVTDWEFGEFEGLSVTLALGIASVVPNLTIEPSMDPVCCACCCGWPINTAENTNTKGSKYRCICGSPCNHDSLNGSVLPFNHLNERLLGKGSDESLNLFGRRDLPRTQNPYALTEHRELPRRRRRRRGRRHQRILHWRYVLAFGVHEIENILCLSGRSGQLQVES